MHRRQLLRASGSAALLSVTTRLWAAPAGSGRFLVIFLRGGYDAASLLVPYASPFYYESRPDIAIKVPSADSDSALPLDANWGLHPALRDTVHPLFQRGEAAFIPFAGVDDLSRSHFETQDSIELAQPPGSRPDYRSGFLARLAAVLGLADPIAFTSQLPLAFAGPQQVANVALRGMAKPSLDARQAAIIAAMYAGTPQQAQVEQSQALRGEVMGQLANEMTSASRGAGSAKGFELEARRVAALMAGRHRVGFIDIGGWDTHVNQGAAQGYLASRLDELGRGLAALAVGLGPAWQDTTVLVISEFGRTFRQNGNRGTDHGHGTVYWLLGGSVRGNRIAGDQVPIGAVTLFQNRDFPVLNEFRAVAGGLLSRQFGLTAAQLQTVFPGAQPKDLSLL